MGGIRRPVTLALAAASILALAACGGSSGASDADTVPTAAPASSATASTATTSVRATSTTTSTTAAPTTAAPTTTVYAPEAIDSTKAGEGQWEVAASIDGTPVVWTTKVHPLAKKPSVVATAAVIDQARLHAVLFNGPLIPGGRDWKYGNHVPASMLPALVATFNGGFELKHMKGGYFTEGRTVKRLRKGDATLAIDRNGRIVIGVYGTDLTNDGTWETLRQNLPPVVLDGKPVIDKAPGTYWGDDFGNVSDNFRSALCMLGDGRLMYVAMGLVDIRPLASGLVAMGCRTAMALDQNGSWPHFATYGDPGASKRAGKLLDRRMQQPNRAITRSKKDFVGLFDPDLLVPDAVG